MSTEGIPSGFATANRRDHLREWAFHVAQIELRRPRHLTRRIVTEHGLIETAEVHRFAADLGTAYVELTTISSMPREEDAVHEAGLAGAIRSED